MIQPVQDTFYEDTHVSVRQECDRRYHWLYINIQFREPILPD
jgi:hypothetical protein